MINTVDGDGRPLGCAVWFLLVTSCLLGARLLSELQSIGDGLFSGSVSGSGIGSCRILVW